MTQEVEENMKSVIFCSHFMAMTEHNINTIILTRLRCGCD